VVAALAEFGISNPQPVTAADAIRRGLVLGYVTGTISGADERHAEFDGGWLLAALKRAMPVPWPRRVLQDELVDHGPVRSPSRSATPPQAAEILGFGGISSDTMTGDVADGDGCKSAENLNCGGVADRGKGSTGMTAFEDSHVYREGHRILCNPGCCCGTAVRRRDARG
jgi:hypothetical protein